MQSDSITISRLISSIIIIALEKSDPPLRKLSTCVDRELSIRADNGLLPQDALTNDGRARSRWNYSGNSNRYRGNERRNARQWPVISSSRKQNARALFLWARQVAPNVALCESSDTWPVVDLLSDKLHVITACGRGEDDRDHRAISFARERAAILASDSRRLHGSANSRAIEIEVSTRRLAKFEKRIRNDRSSSIVRSIAGGSSSARSSYLSDASFVTRARLQALYFDAVRLIRDNKRDNVITYERPVSLLLLRPRGSALIGIPVMQMRGSLRADP